MKKVSITIDLEDWFQVENLRSYFPRESWKKDLIRFEKPLNDLLMLFNKYNIKVTFFVLGWIAERYPEIIENIYNEGHEISSHGMSHTLNNELHSYQMKREIRESKKLLEDTIDDKVYGYRAPSFSISDDILEVLLEEGYKYDSSYFPFDKHKRYGKLSEKKLKEINEKGFKEFEIPLSNFFNNKIPYAGGAYFRILPLWFIKFLFNHTDKEIVVFYFHPWEFDTGMPKIKDLSLGKKFRHYYGVKRNIKKIDKLMFYIKKKNFCFYKLKDLGDIKVNGNKHQII